MTDNINHPKHYTSHPSGVECVEIAEHFGFCLGNAIKYIWRAGLKNKNAEIEDLQKAHYYIDREIRRLRDAAIQAGVHLAARPPETLWPPFPGATPPIETNQHGNPP